MMLTNPACMPAEAPVRHKGLILFVCFLAQNPLQEIAVSPLQQTRPGEQPAGAGLPEGQLQIGPGPSGPPPGSTSCWVPYLYLQESAPRPEGHLRPGGPEHAGEQAELRIPVKRKTVPFAVCNFLLNILFFFGTSEKITTEP